MSDTATTFPLCTTDASEKAFVFAVNADYAFMVLREEHETVFTVATCSKVVESFKKLYSVYKVTTLERFATEFFKAADVMGQFVEAAQNRKA